MRLSSTRGPGYNAATAAPVLEEGTAVTDRSELVMTLGKVLIAAAWADHDLADEEVNSLKDLLFHLPDLTARQWSELDIYLHSPVGAAERGRLLEELGKCIQTEKDRQLALEHLEDLVHSDGTLPPEEEQAFDQIRRAIEDADTGVLGLMGNLVGGAVSRRSAATADHPNREEQLEDFVRNRIYYTLRRRMNLGETELMTDLSEERLRTLSLAGGLMARVAHVDEDITDDELKTMVSALEEDWELTEEEATYVAGVAITEVAKDLDPYRLTREFYEATSRQARVHFLEALFAVAAADGRASHQEIEDIRSISRTLKLSHSEFIEAKLTLPKEQRAN